MDIPIEALVATLIGSVLSLITSFVSVIRKRKKSNTTLEERIKALTLSLATSAELISQVELEISEKEKLVEKLKNDTEVYNALLSLQKGEVEAVTNVLKSELKVQNKKSFWLNFLINFLFFAAGAGVSLLIRK